MRFVIALLFLVACRGESRTDIPRPDQMIGGNIVPRSHVIPAGHIAEVRGPLSVALDERLAQCAQLRRLARLR